VAAVDQVVERMGGGGLVAVLLDLAEADIVELCGASHNSTHVEHLVM
jgi:hypothetical protein